MADGPCEDGLADNWEDLEDSGVSCGFVMVWLINDNSWENLETFGTK